MAQLRTVYPGVPDAELWRRIGVTEMDGVDDCGPAETLTLTDARVVERGAAARQVAVLSFWALQRDNGGFPGTAGSGACSGVVQQPWAYRQRTEAFTS